MMRLLIVPALILALMPPVSVASPPSWAAAGPSHHGERESHRGGGITLEQAVRRIRHRTGGRILSTRTVHKNGRTVYRIKVLTQGQRVRTYSVDAGGR